MKKILMRRLAGGALFALLVAVSTPAYPQDLKKLAADLATKIKALKHDRVTVVDFGDLANKPTPLGKYLALQLTAALSEDPTGLEIVDQSQIPQLFEQVKLLDEGLLDPASGKQLGKVAGTEVVILGQALPSSLSVKLSVKAVDLQTAKVVAMKSLTVTRIGMVDTLAGRAEKGGAGAAEEIADGEAAPVAAKAGKAKKASPRTRRDQDFVFDLDGCSLSGQDLTCAVTVTNEGTDRWVAVGFGSRSWDPEGGEHPPSDIALANATVAAQGHTDSWRCLTKELLEGVPTRLAITFQKFGEDFSQAQQLRVEWAPAQECATRGFRQVSFDKIALSEEGAFSARPTRGGSHAAHAKGDGAAKSAGGFLSRTLGMIQDKAMDLLDRKTDKLMGADDEEENPQPAKKKKKKADPDNSGS